MGSRSLKNFQHSVRLFPQPLVGYSCIHGHIFCLAFRGSSVCFFTDFARPFHPQLLYKSSDRVLRWSMNLYRPPISVLIVWPGHSRPPGNHNMPSERAKTVLRSECERIASRSTTCIVSFFLLGPDLLCSATALCESAKGRSP